jgi:ABC-2 type transport system permease protein
MFEALAINAVLFVVAIAGFVVLLNSARSHGKLIQSGE